MEKQVPCHLNSAPLLNWGWVAGVTLLLGKHFPFHGHLGLQLLQLPPVYLLIKTLPFCNTEIYTASHLSTVYAIVWNQTQDQRNSIRTISINPKSKGETAASDLLNGGRDKDVFAQGPSRDTIMPHLALIGHTRCKIPTLH